MEEGGGGWEVPCIHCNLELYYHSFMSDDKGNLSFMRRKTESYTSFVALPKSLFSEEKKRETIVSKASYHE